MDFFMRFPGGRKKALTLSYDDGTLQDIRLIEIMKKHGLKGTFNLNSGMYPPEDTVFPEDRIYRKMTKSQATKTFTGSGMEVAVHGMMHPFLEQLPTNLGLRDILKDRENLEEQFDAIIRGMAYPYGTYNDQVIDCLRYAGILYSRTVHETHTFDMPENWLLWDPTCHHADLELMELAEKFVEKPVGRDPWLFYVWGHTYEFDTRNNWHVIEEFAEYIGNREDIWYATNIEICEYAEAYNRLVFSMDEHRIYNPTAFTLWFEKVPVFWNQDSAMYCIKPGEIINI